MLEDVYLTDVTDTSVLPLDLSMPLFEEALLDLDLFTFDENYEYLLNEEDSGLLVSDNASAFMVGTNVHARTRTVLAVTMDENAYAIQVPEFAWEPESITEAELFLVDVDFMDYYNMLNNVNDTSYIDISPHIIIGRDDRTRVTNTRIAPYRSIVEVWVGWPDGSMVRGTGFFGDRDDVVITSGHLLFNPARGGWAIYTSVFTSAGHFNGGWIWGGGSWVHNGHRDGDFGIIQLHQNTGENVLPLRVLSDNQLMNSSITLAGYPGDLSGMWRSTGRIREVWRHRFLHDADTVGGSSGSPIYNSQNQVIGIHRGNVSRNEWDTQNITRINDAITMNHDFIGWLRRVAF